jgi:hypothetical protein
MMITEETKRALILEGNRYADQSFNTALEFAIKVVELSQSKAEAIAEIQALRRPT